MKDKIPPSASSFLINLFGGICFITSIKTILFFYPETDYLFLGVISLIAAIVPIVFCEVVFLKVHKRPHLGLAKRSKPDRERVSLKLLGYYGSLAFAMFLYFVIPEYKHDFYQTGFLFLIPIFLIYVMVGWMYVSEMDRYLADPYDAYWHFGNLLAGRWHLLNREILFAHLKSLLLRAYFIPVMLCYLAINTELLTKGNEDFINTYLADIPSDVPGLFLLKLFILIYFMLAVMDVLFAVIGYLMTLRIFDSHIRSTEPTFLGWFVCLMCYYPFWETVVIAAFFQDFYSNPQWHEWFKDTPLLITFWGPLVIAGICLESLTTLTFGVRFSNLTYRGLITAGPFRLTKHPQYIFKMMNRFFFFVPFLSLFGFWGAFKAMIMFAGICFVYYLRARTEENHLSRYPEYVEYANWINENGIFKKVGKLLPFIVYSEEKAKAGKLF